MRHVKWINYLMLAVFFVFTQLFVPTAYAQQPPDQSRLSKPLFYEQYGPKAFKDRLKQRLLARKVQASQPAKPTPGKSKCGPTTCDELLAKARQHGSVNVIVLLDIPNLPDDTRVPKKDRPAVLQARQAAIRQAQEAFLQRMSAHKIRIGRKFTLTPGMSMTVDATVLKAIIEDSQIKSIQENLPDRPMLPQSIPMIGADQAWTNGFTGLGYTVAILDTGVDTSHSFLAGKVVLEACFSGAVFGSASLCPNDQNSEVGAGAAAPCGLPGCGHGTHVSGIAVGSSSGFSGVAKDAGIIAIQVFSDSGGQLVSFIDDQIAALDYVKLVSATYNVVAVNMSLGGGAFTSFCDSDQRKPSIDALRNLGIATIIASGNDGLSDAISAPACISAAISVGATTKSDAVASYSNSASFLSLLAPGGDGSGGSGDIYSSVPGSGFDYKAGTSMAAPHVAGAFAVLKQQSPTATVSDIASILESNGVPVTDTRNNITKPRIRLSNIPWVARYSGPAKYDIAFGIVTDAVGNAHVTGNSCRQLRSDGTCMAFDYATVKYDGNGRRQWTARYGDVRLYGDRVGIALDGFGNVYVAGTICSARDESYSCMSSDFATVKYDSNGSQLWVRTYNNGESYSLAVGPAVDSLGNVYVSGLVYNDYASGMPNQKWITMKYATNGNVLWKASYTSVFGDPLAVRVDNAGSVYVVGAMCFQPAADGGCAGPEPIAGAIVKYDMDGNQLWVVSSPNVWWNDVSFDSQGNAYLTGSLCRDGGSCASHVEVTAKYDRGGNKVWSTERQQEWSRGTALAVDINGNVYVAGQLWVDDYFDYDYFTSKYDNNGLRLWTVQFPNKGEDSPTQVGANSLGHVYVTGYMCNSRTEYCGDFDYVTVNYDGSGNQRGVVRHRVGDTLATGYHPLLTLDGTGNVFVAGSGCKGDEIACSSSTGSDYLTFKYPRN